MARSSLGVLKSLVRATLGSGPALRIVRATGLRRASVFMLHRFADPALGTDGIESAELRRTLCTLRRRGIATMALRELVRRIGTGEGVAGPTAVFTVDDGYRDFATVAAPLFAEFDCPVTMFLISDFVGGTGWCWWDRVEMAFLETRRAELAIECNERTWRYALTDASARQRAVQTFVEVLKRVPDGERRRVVDAIGDLLDVELPRLPPLAYASMSWDEVRRLEGGVVEFGPHTRTHPILAKLDDDAAWDEVAGSWADVRRECRDPAPVFCYPNGTFESYGERDMRLVEESGMVAAVAVHDGYVDDGSAFGGERFRLPRFPWPGDTTTTAYRASGLARLNPAPPARGS